ncbi:cadherin repeat domain-containing protein, partial [Opitutales bacterium]|nr:cadherin repeat domain-containing protein [Opitutales bacterium]
ENDPPAIASPATASVPENTVLAMDLNGTDPDGDTLVYSIAYGDDQNRFDMNTTSGALTFLAPPDFENPLDDDSNNVYELTVQVTDGEFNATKNLAITVIDVHENDPPVITSPATAVVPENTTFAIEVNGTDPDGDALVYSIAYGDDQNRFDLNATSGELTFLVPPDFENPNDDDSNNVYELTVQVTDGEFNATKNLAITVVDLIEESENYPDGNETFVDHNHSDPDHNDSFVDYNSTWPGDDNNDTFADANTSVPDGNSTFVDDQHNYPDGNETFVDHNHSDPDNNDTFYDDNSNYAPSPSYSPIARTMPIEMDADGRLVLQGLLLTDGGSAVTNVGFLLSHSLFADLSSPGAIAVEGTLSGETFTASTVIPDLGKQFYYRAYATNAKGTNFGSPKHFVVPESSFTSAWWQNTEAAEAGWRISSWFGAFLPYGNEWLYHAELGWLYAQSDGIDGLWLWSKDHGWLWTNPGSYRYLYRASTSEWLYFLKHKDGRAYLYNYATGLVE